MARRKIHPASLAPSSSVAPIPAPLNPITSSSTAPTPTHASRARRVQLPYGPAPTPTGRILAARSPPGIQLPRHPSPSPLLMTPGGTQVHAGVPITPTTTRPMQRTRSKDRSRHRRPLPPPTTPTARILAASFPKPSPSPGVGLAPLPPVENVLVAHAKAMERRGSQARVAGRERREGRASFVFGLYGVLLIGMLAAGLGIAIYWRWEVPRLRKRDVPDGELPLICSAKLMEFFEAAIGVLAVSLLGCLFGLFRFAPRLHHETRQQRQGPQTRCAEVIIVMTLVSLATFIVGLIGLVESATEENCDDPANGALAVSVLSLSIGPFVSIFHFSFELLLTTTTIAPPR